MFATEADIVGRFFQEAKAAAALNHPNVVDVLDMGQEDHDVFLVLEFLEGQPLGALLEDRARLSPAEALPILLPVIDALGAAHERGILHRDLKPDNIFVSRDLRGRKTPKVLDFGVAKLSEGDSSVETRTGGVVGTPEYMSPEQAQGKKDLGPAADVWSMGAVLYETMAGARAFRAESIPALLLQICSFDPLPLEERSPDVPPAIAHVVARALARDLDVRYPSMEALGRALVDAASESNITIPPPIVEMFSGAPRLSRLPMPTASSTETADTVLGTGADSAVSSAAVSEPSRSERPAWAIGLVLALLGLGAIVAAYLVIEPRSDPPDPPPETIAVADPPPVDPPLEDPPVEDPPLEEPPDPPTGIEPPDEDVAAPGAPIRVLSVPPGATVFHEGERLGRTPLELERPEGEPYTIELRRAGYARRRVRLSGSSAAELTVLLESAPGIRRPPTYPVSLRDSQLMRCTSIFVALAVLVGTAQFTTTARADRAAEARFHDELARRHYGARRFEQAAREFMIEQRLAPNPNIVFNIGLCFQQLRRPAEAYMYFAEYLASGDDETRRSQSEHALEELRPQVALVRGRERSSGAGDLRRPTRARQYGTTPRVLALDAGEHRIWVEREGYRRAETTLTLALARQAEVSLSPEQILGRLRGDRADRKRKCGCSIATRCSSQRAPRRSTRCFLPAPIRSKRWRRPSVGASRSSCDRRRPPR